MIHNGCRRVAPGPAQRGVPGGRPRAGRVRLRRVAPERRSGGFRGVAPPGRHSGCRVVAGLGAAAWPRGDRRYGGAVVHTGPFPEQAMSWPAEAVMRRVPATSANLGPGFHAPGPALALHDELEARAARGGPSAELPRVGAATPAPG